jgi:Glycosyl transferase family 90
MTSVQMPPHSAPQVAGAEFLLKTPAPHQQWMCSTQVFWTGDCSTVRPQGALVQFLIDWFKAHPSPKWFYMPRADGDVSLKGALEALMSVGVKEEDANASIEGGQVLIGTLSQRFPIFKDPDLNRRCVVYMPQDDGIFAHGLMRFFEPFKSLIPWDQKRPGVFWRGSCSADYKNGEFLRRDVVAMLCDHPACDVKLVRNWSEGKVIPNHYFGDPRPIPYFMGHKVILIIDGNGLSSNHSWPFASGSVPLIISNCRFWFEKELVPFKNHVPVKYDLSDLIEKIDWILSHDEEARAIAEGALALAQTVLTPEFQENYLRGVLVD